HYPYPHRRRPPHVSSRLKDYRSYPWTVPIPVRRSTFVSLRREHADFNVEIDLARIGAFKVAERALHDDEVLYADLQDASEYSLWRCLGAGRSGFHRDKY